MINIPFAVENKMTIAAGDFNHCSTLAPLGEGMLVAFYAGTGECRDDQSVYLLYIKNQVIEFRVRIGDKTGNPVLWPVSDNKAVLLYSQFEDKQPIKRIIDRWKHCSLWVRTIKLENGQISVSSPIKFGTRPHLLGRCAPVKIDQLTLLPLYDEVKGCGVIYSLEGEDLTDFKHVTDIGQGMIQPTLSYVSDPELSVIALSRNFGNHYKFSLACVSPDLGRTWSPPTHTDIPNNNSSLHLCKWGETIYILWNNTMGTRRINLMLGELNSIDGLLVAKSIGKVADFGHYPSIIQHNERLYFCFTNKNKEIEYHEWNKRQLTKVQKATEKEQRGYSTRL